MPLHQSRPLQQAADQSLSRFRCLGRHHNSIKDDLSQRQREWVVRRVYPAVQCAIPMTSGTQCQHITETNSIRAPPRQQHRAPHASIAPQERHMCAFFTVVVEDRCKTPETTPVMMPLFVEEVPPARVRLKQMLPVRTNLSRHPSRDLAMPSTGKSRKSHAAATAATVKVGQNPSPNRTRRPSRRESPAPRATQSRQNMSVGWQDPHPHWFTN